ncbi:MAG: hypothetical protein ACLS4Y_05580 [Faecalibacterium sp.]
MQLELCLPAAQELNLNPSLLTGFLEEKFGLPAVKRQHPAHKVFDGRPAAVCLIASAKVRLSGKTENFCMIFSPELLAFTPVLCYPI